MMLHQDPGSPESTGSELNISGILLQEESLESDEDDRRTVAKAVEFDTDTDTDGEQLTLQEAAENLKLLASNMEQTANFYSQLVTTLNVIPLQNLDSDHPIIRSCISMLKHVAYGIANPETRAWACVPFSLIIRNRACVHELLRSTHAIDFLIDAIQEVESENLRVVLLSSVRLLSASRGCRQEIVRCHGIEMLLYMVAQPASGEVSKAHVIFALRRICKTTTSREHLAKLRGVAPLLQYFFECRTQPVQKSLAGLLQTLATNPEIKVQVAELGAIPKLVELLTLSNMHMLKYVICIVRNVACNNDENRLLIAQAGGIRLLLQLMPVVSVKLQQKIAGALQNLATNRDNRAAISEFGGVAVLIALIKTEDQKLQKYGLGGLKRLVYNSRESTLEFEKLGGLPALIALLDSDDPSVLKNAVHALNRVRHYLGREPIEQLGGVAGMGRLLTSPHEKIRVLARRNLASMDEDLNVWIQRIERIALQLLRAARVLLNAHQLVHPAVFAECKAAEPTKRRMSVSSLRKTLRASRDPVRRSDSEPVVPSSMSTAPVVAALSASTSATTAMDAEVPEEWAHLRSMTPEKAHVLSTLGYGETYWHLRPGTCHMLPVPLLQMIIARIDDEHLLSGAQRRAIFAWARDRSTLGRSVQDFIFSITNNAMSASSANSPEEVDKKGCIIS